MSAPGGLTRAQALALHRAGDLDGAEAVYRTLLTGQPNDAVLVHGLCVLLLQRGRDAEADSRVTALLQTQNAGPAWVLLAQIRQRQGRFDGALAALERARAAGLRDVSLDVMEAALWAASGDDARAEATVRHVLQAQPDAAEAWHVFGQVRHRAGAFGEAIAAYREALQRAPASAAVHFNLGLSAEAAGDLELAREHLGSAVQKAPQRIEAVGRLAAVQARLLDFAGEATSVAALEKLLLQPGRETIEPLLLTFLPLSDEAKRAALDGYEHNVRVAVAAVPRPALSTATARTVRRIGYLSPDFGHHAVGGLMRDVFAAHDRTRVAVYAYSQRTHAGETADTIRAGCDVFREVAGLSFVEVAQRIREDALDVLIDLGGYTLGADARVLALRPAPRQVAYLGFIHDYGAEWIDALLLDGVVAPDTSRFTHRVLPLAGTLLPASRALDAAPDRAAFDLPPDAIVFASFNNSYKLDRALLGAWLAIHRGAPQAIFLIVLPEPAQARLRAAWRAGGGDVAALRFGGLLPPERHAARAASCDLLLDAFRYHAGATAIASLGAGLPILCKAGATPLARMSASVNRFLGLDELVVDSVDAYVAQAIALARAPARLRALRDQACERAEARGLFDPRRTAAAIEAGVDTLCAEVDDDGPARR